MIERVTSAPPFVRVLAAFLVVVLVFVSVAKVRSDSNDAVHSFVTADDSGSIEATIGSVKIDSPNGTFKAGEKVSIAVLSGGSVAMPTGVALSDLRSVAVKLEAPTQPAKPVRVTLPITSAEPDEPIFGLLTDDQGRTKILVAAVSGGLATVEVPHFTVLFLVGAGVMAAIAMKDLVGAVIDSARLGTCNERIPGQPLRQVAGSGNGLVGLVLLPVPADRFRVSVRLCNQLKVWQEYDMTSVSGGSGWLAPFSTVDEDIVLGANEQGSTVAIRSRLTPRSFALTLAELFTDVLPGAFDLYRAVGGAAGTLAESVIGLTCVVDANARYSVELLLACFNTQFVEAAIKLGVQLAELKKRSDIALALKVYGKFANLFVSILGPLARGLPQLFYAVQQSEAVYQFRVDIAGLQTPPPTPSARTPSPVVVAPTRTPAPVVAGRDSLPVTATPVVGRYFRVPVDVLPGCCVDGAGYGNTVRAGTVVMIKGGPRTGQAGRVWWDLSEVEWGGGTGWFTMQIQAAAPPTTPPPAPVSTPTLPPTPAPTPAATPAPGSGCGDPLSTEGTGSPAPLPGSFGVSYSRKLAPGFAPHAPQRAIGYAFNVAGFDLTQLPLSHKISGLIQSPTQWICGWTSVPEFAFVLLVQPEAPTGTYTLTLRLPDGRTATAQFPHQQVR